MRFLLVEDNEELAETVQTHLRLEGHAVDWAGALEAAQEFLDLATYDLILLDIMLPDGDGRDFLDAHRRTKGATPVIVMTARSGVSDRVALLDTGADDYITKPFDFQELSARIRAVLRRQTGPATPDLSFADLVYHTALGTVTVAGEPRAFRSRELRLLEVFIRTPDRLYSKAQLCDRLFSASDPVTDNAIEVYVGRLRKKLEGSAARIETVRGLGYRLTNA